MNTKKQRSSDRYSIDPDIGRLQPQAREIEEAVLGALMLDREAYPLVSGILSPEMFYDKANEAVFRAIQTLSELKRPVDMVTVFEALKSTGEAEMTGGAYRLSQLTGKVAGSSHIEYHARVIEQKYLARELIRLTNEIQQRAFDETEDVDEILEALEIKFTEISIRRTASESVEMSKVVHAALEKAASVQEERAKGISPSIATGIENLTKAFYGGWKAPDLIVLAARPSMGKSQLALHFAKSATEAGRNVLFVSIEMSAIQLVNRLLLEDNRISAYNLATGQMSSDEWDAIDRRAGEIWNLKLHIADSPEIRYLDAICSEARRLKRKGKLDMLVIDYLGLILVRNQKFERRQLEIARITGTLKSLAKELDIPVMLLSQLNRPAKGANIAEPQLHDLRECLPVDEWVDTPSGVVQLKTRPKTIITVDGQGSKTAECEYINKKYNDTYTVRTKFGAFTATARHRVLTATGWKYVCELDVERDVLASPDFLAHENRGYMPKGRFLGWMIGNGYLSGTPSLVIRNELLDELKAEVESFGVNVRPRKTRKSDNVTEVYLSNGVSSGCAPNPLMQWIRSLGMEGKTAKIKSIPDIYLGTSSETHKEILRGLWESDGTVTKGVAKYSTVSELLARQVKWLLHTIGVRSSIVIEKGKKENYSDVLTVVCSIEDNENMLEVCGNSARFGELKIPCGKYTDPCPEIFARLANEYCKSGRAQKNVSGDFKKISKRRLLEMLKSTPISTILESPFVKMQNIGWTRITAISHNDKEVRVCDLHVPETNCFLTNGMIVHNSGDIEQDADVVLFIHRPNYYDEDNQEWKGRGKIIIAKYREGVRNRAVAFCHDSNFKKIWGGENAIQRVPNSGHAAHIHPDANFEPQYNDSPF